MIKEQVSRLMVMKNQVFRECRVNFIEETVVVMKNQVFREYRINFIEKTDIVMEKQAFRLMVMKK